MADIPRKTFAGIAAAVTGVTAEQLRVLLTDAKWDHHDYNRQRVGIMIERATAGDGVLDIDGVLRDISSQRSLFGGLARNMISWLMNFSSTSLRLSTVT